MSAICTKSTVIDWAFVGPQPAGADAVTLIVLSILWARDREPDDLSVLSQRCHDGYVAGLRDEGWAGAEWPVRLGYTAMMALCFVALPGAMLAALAGPQERV